MTAAGKKVALLLPNLEAGGAERVMLALAEQFASSGAHVDLLVGDAAGRLVGQVPSTVALVPLMKTSMAASRLSFAARLCVGLVHYLREIKPDCLLSTLTGTNLVALVARRLAGTRTRLAIREASTFLNIRSRLTRRAMDLIYPWSDVCIASTNAMAHDLTSVVSPDRIQVIPNPVDADRIRALSQELISHEWLPGDDLPMIVAVGRLVDAKDFGTLIHSFKRLLGRRRARLVIVGDGPLRPRLTALVKALDLEDVVSLPGFLENPFPIVRRASAFALSSRWEGFPSSLVEAMVLNVPIVSTDCHSGPREILDNGRLGRLVPVGDIEAMSRALVDTLDDGPSAIAQYDLDRFGPVRVGMRYLEALLPTEA
jgi:glycosyltransferase involved in cell wall biosynthesis